MSHPTFSDLMAYADGESDAAARKLVEDHLSSCRECRSILETQGHIEKAWRGSFVEPGAAQFSRLERAIAGRITRKPLYIRMLPVAAALLVALAGVRLMSSEHGLAGRREPVPVPVSVLEAPETVLVVASAQEISDSTSSSERQVDLEQSVGLGEAAQVGVLAQAEAPAADTGGGEEAEGNQQAEAAVYGGVAGLAGTTSGESGSGVGGSDLDAAAGITQTGLPDACGRDLGADGATGEFQENVSTTDYGAGYAGDILEEQHGAYLSVGAAAAGGGGAAQQAAGEPTDSVCRSRVEDDRTLEAVCTVEATSDASCSESAAAAEDLQYLGLFPGGAPPSAAFSFPAQIVFLFDSLGNPSSPDSLLLDEGFDGWKDSIEGRFEDSLVFVPLGELPEFLD